MLRFQVLCKFAEEQLFKLRGYRGLFRTSDGYRVYAEKEIWPDLSFPIVLTYWVSKTLDYTFYADPFESLIASFDAVNSNVEQSSHASEAKSLALLVATSIIKKQRQNDLALAMELGNAFDVSLPSVLTGALFEASNLHELFNVILQMRSEARSFRKKMRKLDECRAGVSEIKDALRDMERVLQGWAKLLRYIRIGRMLIVAPVQGGRCQSRYPVQRAAPVEKDIRPAFTASYPSKKTSR